MSRKAILIGAVILVAAGAAIFVALWPQLSEQPAPPRPQPLSAQKDSQPSEEAASTRTGEAAEAAEGDESSTAFVVDDINDIKNAPKAPGEEEKIRVYGTVCDTETGSPIPEASITPEHGEAVATDEDGAFSIQVAKRHEVRLTCKAAGYAQAVKKVSKNEGTEQRIDFMLGAESAIAGVVTDAATGEAIQGVEVQAHESGGSFMERMEAIGRGTNVKVTTAEDGSYRLAGLKAAAYNIGVSARTKGYLFGREDVISATLKEGEQRDGADFALKLGAMVQGTVRNEQGQVIEDAHISVMPANFMAEAMDQLKAPMGAVDMLEGLGASSSEEGHYELSGLDYDKEFILNASADGYADGSSPSFTITQGASPAKVDIVLATGCLVAGVAQRPDGTPAADERIRLTRLQNEGGPFGFRPPESMKTDEEGKFEFAHVGAGKYSVGSRMPMPFQEGGTGETIEVDGETDVTGLVITVEDRKKVAAGKKKGGSITGTVLRPDGSPAPSASVSATAGGMAMFMGGGNHQTTTAEDGTFTLSDLPGGSFTVSAKADGAIGEAAGVDIGAKVTIQLAPAATISGMVVTKAGEGVEGCQVRLKDEGKDENPMEAMLAGMMGRKGGKKTDLNGFFKFENVKPGAYVVDALSKTKGSGATKTINVAAAAEVKDLRIALEPGVAVAGTVVNRAGQTVSGAALTLIKSGEGGMAEMMSSFMPAGMAENAGTATSDDSGNFRIENVPIGTYTIAASHGEYAPAKISGIALTAGRDKTGQRVVLPNPAKISGKLVVDGKVIAGAMVQFIGEGGMQMTFTDSDGNFEVTGLAPGNYMMNTVDMNAATSGNPLDAMVGSPRSVEVGEGEDLEYDGSPVPGSQPVGGLVTGEGLGNMTMVTLRRPGGPAPEDMDPMNPMAGIEAMRYQAGQAVVKEDGTFTMPDVPPGDYILEVHSFDFDMANIDVNAMMNMDRTPAYRQELTVGEEPVVTNIPIGAGTP